MIFEVAGFIFCCGNPICVIGKPGNYAKIYIIIDKRVVIWYNYIL